MTEQDPGQPAEEFHRDRREHGGIPGHLEEARAEIRREYDKDELTLEHERDPYPPTRYDE
jgi:hypothetical protein